jgi:pimeloyl-ACP methyl ester carboxylesterase
MRVRYAKINGIRTRYYEAGSGRPVMLIHGVGSTADTWFKTVEALGKEAHVVAVDLVGHGYTEQVPYKGAPQPHMLDHIFALADHVGFKKFSVCGSSYGAMLALLVYLRAKERIEKIVLLSSASATLSDEERIASMKKAYNASVDAYRDPTYDSIVGRMKNLFHNAARIPHELVLIQLNIFSQTGMLQNFEQLMQGIMDPDAIRPFRVDNRFGEIAAPMLMLWGLNDKQGSVPRAKAAAAQAPEAYFIGVEECGHIPHLEQAEKVNALIASFLRGDSFAQHRVTA